MTHILFPELSYAVQGACFDVHNRLRGLNLSEAGWERALLIALTERGIGSQSQVQKELAYQGRSIGHFIVDIVVEGKLLLELKAVERLLPIHQAQLLSYLRATGLELGILVNFGEPRLASQRMVLQTARIVAREVPQPFTERADSGDLLYPELTGRLRNALYTVHDVLGPGFMHMHYRRATQLELPRHEISYRKQDKVTISYRGQPIETRESRLLIVNGLVALACVAISATTPAMTLQMRQYLKLLDLSLGLIANFHGPQLDIQTVRVRTKPPIDG